MSRKKVSTTIYITPEQADRLKLLHERTKVPISVYIREGIDLMLKHYEHVLPGQMSLEAAAASASPASAPPPPPVAVASVTQATPRREPVATLRTGSTGHDGGHPHAPGHDGGQAGPTRSGDGGA
jgi:predicted DNA-binding protein